MTIDTKLEIQGTPYLEVSREARGARATANDIEQRGARACGAGGGGNERRMTMATGLTYPIIERDDYTFREFALHCATQFGACIHQRDEGGIEPRHREKSAFYAAELKRAQARVRELSGMNEAQKRAILDARVTEIATANVKEQADHAAKIRRLRAMLAKVQAWTPPTPEHNGLRDLMVRQVTSTIEHEGEPYVLTPPASAEEYYDGLLRSALDDVGHYRKKDEEDSVCVAEANAWIDALVGSLAVVEVEAWAALAKAEIARVHTRPSHGDLVTDAECLVDSVGETKDGCISAIHRADEAEAKLAQLASTDTQAAMLEWIDRATKAERERDALRKQSHAWKQLAKSYREACIEFDLIDGASLAALAPEKMTKKTKSIVGQYVIARCNNAGVHAGVVESTNEHYTVLRGVRRIWRWSGAASLSEIAVYGLNPARSGESRIAAKVSRLRLRDGDICELIVCTKEGRASVEGQPEWRA